MKHIQESIIGRKGASTISVEGVKLTGLRPIRLSYYSMREGGNIIIVRLNNGDIIPYMSTNTEDIWGDARTINRDSLGDGYYMVTPDEHHLFNPYGRIYLRPCDDFRKDFPKSSDRFRPSGTVIYILKPERDIFNEILHGGNRANEIFKEFYKETSLDIFISKLR